MSLPDVQLSCPHCGHSLSVAFAEMTPGHSKLCPQCGKSITFSGTDAARVEQALSQLQAQLGSANVKVTVKTRVKGAARPWWKFWA
ncbi:MAG TPA: hypothetical protein VFM34_10990 [Moraxellaceae bacterium]|nr:hypothetical protein [Moraxellaceae bacterium]